MVLYITIGLLTGLGFGMMYLPAIDVVNHFFSRRLGLAMGIASCGCGLGTMVLAPLIQLMIDQLHLAGRDIDIEIDVNLDIDIALAGTLFCLSGMIAAAAFFALFYRSLSLSKKEVLTANMH